MGRTWLKVDNFMQYTPIIFSFFSFLRVFFRLLLTSNYLIFKLSKPLFWWIKSLKKVLLTWFSSVNLNEAFWPDWPGVVLPIIQVSLGWSRLHQGSIHNQSFAINSQSIKTQFNHSVVSINLNVATFFWSSSSCQNYQDILHIFSSIIFFFPYGIHFDPRK